MFHALALMFHALPLMLPVSNARLPACLPATVPLPVLSLLAFPLLDLIDPCLLPLATPPAALPPTRHPHSQNLPQPITQLTYRYHSCLCRHAQPPGPTYPATTVAAKADAAVRDMTDAVDRPARSLLVVQDGKPSPASSAPLAVATFALGQFSWA